jgi:hypothetical protein
MLKVLGFVRRHERLTRDEYRTAHAGYHNSYGRRLNGIRGYLLNVRANRPPASVFGEESAYLCDGKPADFEERWDGYGQLMFGSLQEYLSAKSPARDRPGPGGLELDDAVAAVGGDAPHLYSGPPIQFHVDEYAVVPVRRPEHKIFKVVHFAKRNRALDPAEFRSRWHGSYGALSRGVPGLLGHLVNIPTSLDVITGFFSEASGAFTDAAARERETFHADVDGLAEYWFSSAGAFRDWRMQRRDPLRKLEDELFESFFMDEVDETVAVLPDRLPPAPFYHR